MKPASSELLARIARAGLEPTRAASWCEDGAFERLLAFFEARRAWAGTHNVSGPRALEDPWGADFIDGVAIAMLGAGGEALVDVGAGSGVPGLVVACLQPQRTVILVEPIAKRTAFLRSVASRLGLDRVRVERARWPIALKDPVEVVSRAVVDPEHWPTLAASGGQAVVSILRMLAARRPPFGLDGFELDTRIDYDAGEDRRRRVERWRRSPPSPGATEREPSV